MRNKAKTDDLNRHFVYRDIGMVKGYKLENETLESDTLIINHIKIDINMSSNVGAEFYGTIKDKFRPENLKPKYATAANYVYTEKEFEDIIRIEIKILTDKTNRREIIAKRKLLCRINKYT